MRAEYPAASRQEGQCARRPRRSERRGGRQSDGRTNGAAVWGRTPGQGRQNVIQRTFKAGLLRLLRLMVREWCESARKEDPDRIVMLEPAPMLNKIREVVGGIGFEPMTPAM